MSDKLCRVTALLLAALWLLSSSGVAQEHAVVSSADGVLADPTGVHQEIHLTKADILIQETETLRLYLREEEGIISVEDRRNGYVFSTGRTDEATNKLSKKWKLFAAALCTGEFITLTNLNTFEETPNVAKSCYLNEGNRIKAQLYFEKAEVTLHVYLWLERNTLRVSIPDDEISKGNENTVLTKLYVLPFMGSSFQSEGPGYIFMPDGAGALIRFDSPESSRLLKLRAYGNDQYLSALGNSLNLTVDLPTKDSERAAIPVMGVAHGAEQAAFVVWAEHGAEYCDLLASPAGNNNLPCYYACFQAVYREIYRQPTSGTEAFNMVQTTRNQVDLQLCYTFLSGEDADYVGMACAYRDHMLETGELNRMVEYSGMPVMIDCLMQESVKAVFGTKTYTMTSFQDIAQWLQLLKAADVAVPILVLEGMMDGGTGRSKYNDTSVSDELGDYDELLAEAEGYATILQGRRFLKYYGAQLPQNQRAYAVTRRFITTVENAYLDDEAYYLRNDRINDLVQKVSQANWTAGVAAEDLGLYLFSNLRPVSCSRPEATALIRTAMETLAADGNLAVANPGDYALAYADMVYDLPVSNSSYEFETDAVPFIQIVLSGCLPMFGRNTVGGATSTEQMLRMIDFNMYQHYTLTAADASSLGKSNSSSVLITRTDSMLECLIADYAYLERYLSPVQGQLIVDRTCPENGVSVTTYESGTIIVVNYNSHSYVYHDVEVAPESAMLIQEGDAP